MGAMRRKAREEQGGSHLLRRRSLGGGPWAPGVGVAQSSTAQEILPRTRVLDVVVVTIGKNARHSAEAIRDLSARYNEVDGNIVEYRNT